MKVMRAPGALRALLVVAGFAAALVQAAPVEIKVMTRNLYVGADVGTVVEAILAVPPNPPAVIAGVIGATFLDVQATRPAERMARIAGEILTHMPHVVGLQELSLWQTRPLGSPNPFVDTFDFYAALNTALGGAASPYTLVTRLTGVPVAGVGFGPGLPPTEIVLTDSAGILVHKDVTVLGFDSISYSPPNLTTIPGFGPVVRGISYVDVEVAGRKARVASTHLDSVDPGKNLAQSQELVDFLDTSPYRQIALGDFNSIVEPFDGFFVPTGSDQKMLDNQFKDTWLEKGGGAPGFTWRDDELLNQLPTDFTQRLDYVFQRGGFSTQSVDIIGEDPLCPLPPATGPCWGSDHAGVLATLAFAPEPGSLALLGLGFALAAWRRRTTA
jgi:hypothetical protein